MEKKIQVKQTKHNVKQQELLSQDVIRNEKRKMHKNAYGLSWPESKARTWILTQVN